MKKSVKLSLGSLCAAGAVAAALLPSATASATEGFACPTGTDTVAVPYAFAADSTPLLAGTVCVRAGTTVLVSVDVAAGWAADVKSAGTKSRTDVRFSNATTGGKVELRYEPGRTEIK